MSEFSFWRRWSGKERILYTFLLSIFSVSLICYTIIAIRGPENALEWNITSTAETVKVPLKNVQVGLFEFELMADNYLINQYYQGSAHHITKSAAYIFLALFSSALVILLSIVTYLKRFWYLVTMSIACFVFVNFRFEQLEIFGWIDNTFLIIVLALVIPMSYYIHSFKEEMPFLRRNAFFAVIFLFLSIVISIYSENSNPFYFLANYNYTAPVVITILFIFLVSHEVVYLILFLVTGAINQPGKGGTFHFIVLSTIYLLNVGLLYLKNAQIIDWDLIYVNAFLLLAMSAVLGVWGFKQREIRYENILPFKPLAAYFFLTLGIICFVTISYHAYTHNDPVIETFEDAIVFSHFGFGIMFLLYILANFINLLNKNLQVYKVAFKEDNMPYFSANMAGLVIVAAFYYLSNQAAFQQAIAGYYNGLGSVYSYEGDNFLAEEYYKRGSIFGYNNHRSNYSLGEMALQEGDFSEAIQRFRNATKKKPSEFAFVNLANAQKNDFLFFDALFSLKEGLRVFPESPQIRNNLGLLFKSTNILDSAIYYMEKGAKGEWGTRTNLTNIFDVLTRNKIELNSDSLQNFFDNSTHLPLKSNLIAYSNNTSKWVIPPTAGYPSDSVLDLHQFAYLYNLEFSKLGQLGGADIIDEYSKAQTNGLFSRELAYLGALKRYALDDMTSFYRSMDLLMNDPINKGYYNHILGIISLENKAPRLAAEYFQKALDEQYESAEVNLAIALTETGNRAQALGVWSGLWQQDSLEVANDIIVSLTAPLNVIMGSGSDALKYQAVRYRSTGLNWESREGLISSISDNNFRAGAYRANIESQIRVGNFDEASHYLNLIGQIDAEVTDLEKRLRTYQFADKEIKVDQLLNDSINEYWFKVDDKKAIDFFMNLGTKNPFQEAEVVIASMFFAQQVKNHDVAYNILINANEINPYSMRIKKAYILEAVQTGLSNYANDELRILKEMMAPDEYDEFNKEVERAILDFDNFSFPTLNN